MKKNSLGKGLSAILGGSSALNQLSENDKSHNKAFENSHEILIENISVNPFQPRKKFKDDDLNELALSIKELGIIQPITVRKIHYDKYQLISGERRLRASKLINLKKIPAYIRVANDKEMLEMALIENIQRKKLNPIEIANSYNRLINECNLTQEMCSERVGKNRTTISNFLRLLKLPKEIQEGLINGDLSTGHAKSLINIKDKETQLNIFHDVIAYGYSVREVEQISKDFADNKYRRISKKQKIKKNELSFTQKKIVYEISEKLNQKVEIKNNAKNNKLIISFKNYDELLNIAKIINGKS